MKKIKELMVSKETSILDAIKKLDVTAVQILLVVDQDERLLGTLTDGDVRRAILNGKDLSSQVGSIMNTHPVTLAPEDTRDHAVGIMHRRLLHCLPVVDKTGKVLGLEMESGQLWQGQEKTLVVLMAGGLGMRLRPLTETTPKPMLKINGKPILEMIIDRFAEQGFEDFLISVNYKAEMIRDYFGDGSSRGLNFSYLEEDKPLGTGGAISQIAGKTTTKNIIVMNGDLLTTLNFRQLLAYHDTLESSATMAVRDYSIRVPYGVVQADNEEFLSLIEKPAHNYFVNAGIYVIKSSLIDYIPKDVFFDLPDLFGLLKSKGEKVTIFPLREEWRDIGCHKDFEEANNQRFSACTEGEMR